MDTKEKGFIARFAKLANWIQAYEAYLGIILVRLTLDVVYICVISPVYGNSGFLLNFSVYKYALSWVATILMTPVIVRLYKDSSVSSTIVLLLNLIYFLPGCTLYSLLGLPDLYFLFYILYWILLMVWQYKIPYVHFTLPSERLAKRVFLIIVIGVSAGALAITGIYNGFQMNFRLDNIYELRAIRREMNLPVIVNYFQPMASHLIPLALVYFLSEKKYIISVVMIVIQLLLFSFGGEKFALFMIPVAVLGFYIYREKRVSWFSWGLVALNIAALIEFTLRKSYWISAYFQNRSLLIPNLNSFYYYDYFSSHTPDFLFQSILRRFGFLSQYDVSIPYIIGLKYYNSISCSANNGMIGDAFSNFAWLSLIIFPLLLVLALRLMDACAHRIDRRLLITIFVGYAITFTNGAFFTVMLTNGFLFVCMVLYLMPREGKVLVGKESSDD